MSAGDDPAEGSARETARASSAAYDSFDDDFDTAELDAPHWLPHYLPAWNSRSETAATWHIAGSCLSLEIPDGQPLWCPEDHEPALRVSGIQSGNRSARSMVAAGSSGSRTNRNGRRLGRLVRLVGVGRGRCGRGPRARHRPVTWHPAT